MKYIMQFGIISIVCFLAELIYQVVPLPIPASIYGLLILFILLLTKIIKIGQIEEISQFFMAIMPFLFLSPSVSLITSLGVIKGKMIPILLVALLSTIATLGVTGIVTQFVIRCKKNKTNVITKEEVSNE